MSGRTPLPPPAPASWRPMLAARPIRNIAARVEAGGDGGLHIAVRKENARWRRRPWKWFVPGRDERLILLDAMGREVWELCDGRCVEAIVEEMSRRHRLSFHEARVAVTALLRELIRRGALAVVLPDEGGNAQKSAR